MIKLSDVAEAAGVSVTTASMVLNPGKQRCRVRPECAERIKLAAQRLNYVGNYHARAMQLGKAETIGLAIDIGDPGRVNPATVAMGGMYFSLMAAGVETHTHFTGYNLTVIGPGLEERAPDRGLRQILQRRLDGLVVAAVLPSIRTSRLICEQPSVPVVLVEFDGVTKLPVVTYDEEQGIVKAVKHLIDLGHRKLLWLGPATDAAGRREQHFIRAVWDAGLKGSSCRFENPEQQPARSNVLGDAAQAALSAHLSQPREFTGIVCYNDAVAVGAYGALMNAGLRIPQDVSVVGFDDFVAEFVFPRLTTVSHVLHEMGLKAAQMAMEMASDPQAIERLRGHREVIAPELVVRSSTGPA
jgi:LacI family transcriptional regulator